RRAVAVAPRQRGLGQRLGEGAGPPVAPQAAHPAVHLRLVRLPLLARVRPGAHAEIAAVLDAVLDEGHQPRAAGVVGTHHGPQEEIEPARTRRAPATASRTKPR